MLDAAIATPVAALAAEAASSHSPAPNAGASRQAEISSETLLHGTRELLIRHGGECYRLRHTRNDKLILTK